MSAPDMLFLVDAWEAVSRVRRGDLGRARELLDAGERGLRGGTLFPGDHAQTLVGSVRAAYCLETGDLSGAEQALAQTYAAALAARDLPPLSLVAVQTAAFAPAHGRQHRAAALLGAASRLRGAHDRTDRQVRDLTCRGRAALGEGAFTAAYGTGRELDGQAAVTAVALARLRREFGAARPGHG
ncbi:hypothetical protein AB0F64_28015 [Streptomyces sp. NPDC026294]|uniref:hypothetical protein n=1 Tax=Streptomyces sp. NPDC026294 TaxID=3155362 RepID=UPI0033FADC04